MPTHSSEHLSGQIHKRRSTEEIVEARRSRIYEQAHMLAPHVKHIATRKPKGDLTSNDVEDLLVNSRELQGNHCSGEQHLTRIECVEAMRQRVRAREADLAAKACKVLLPPAPLPRQAASLLA